MLAQVSIMISLVLLLGITLLMAPKGHAWQFHSLSAIRTTSQKDLLSLTWKFIRDNDEIMSPRYGHLSGDSGANGCSQLCAF